MRILSGIVFIVVLDPLWRLASALGDTIRDRLSWANAEDASALTFVFFAVMAGLVLVAFVRLNRG